MSLRPPVKSIKDEPESATSSGYGPLLITILMFLGVIGVLFHWSSPQLPWSYRLPGWINPARLLTLGSANWVESPLPLVMEGGDPYIRALMRTISASESNMDKPYRLLYGGQTLGGDLSRHPDRCVPITVGPNLGDCTTAAGRYQFLTTTWQAKAEKYHPSPPVWFEFWQTYDFSAQAQDLVVHRWLSDPDAWGVDISQELQAGELLSVLELLSGTWTSLGYGIETNDMSSQLPRIYDQMLEEELATP